MAKNFLDQALSLIGLKSPNATDYYDPSMYRTEVSNSEIASKFSSVEQYQQKQNTHYTATKKDELSGVEKYLAAKQQPVKEQIPTEDTAVKTLTGVAQYLITKQEEQVALTNMTGVAKYLYNLKTDNKKTPTKKTAPEKKATPAKLSRVDMYLAKQQEPARINHAAKVARKMPKEGPKITAKINDKIKTQARKEEPARTTEKTQNKIIDLTEGATQCQAATLKRAQCSRKTSLETIERTINNQQYKFTVCSQHNIDSFIPLGKFLQED